MPAMHSENPRVGLFMTWLGKGLVRFVLLLVAAAAVAAVAAGFGGPAGIECPSVR